METDAPRLALLPLPALLSMSQNDSKLGVVIASPYPQFFAQFLGWWPHFASGASNVLMTGNVDSRPACRGKTLESKWQHLVP